MGGADAQPKGAKPRPLLITFALGLVIWKVVPRPEAVTVKAWQMLAIFVAAICGVVIEPLPVAGVAIMALTIAVGTDTISFASGMAGFNNEVIWFIVVAFFLAKAFDTTRLATRIALTFVRLFGSTTLSLAYGVILAELVLGLAVPSSAARVAGVLFPLVKAMAVEAGDANIGPFLVVSTLQASTFSTSLWITGAATNFLSLDLAAGLGVKLESPFMDWLLPSSVPAILGLIATPVLADFLCPPAKRKTPALPTEAARKLEAMGPMSRDERVLFGTIVVMVFFWSTPVLLDLRPVVTGFAGLSVLLVTGVLEWKDCASEAKVWDMFVWFALLVALSAQLNEMGVVAWAADEVGGVINGWGLPWQATWVLLSTMYFLSHYVFASQVAHISALYQPFVAMLIAGGTPPQVAMLSLAYINNSFSAITNYASAHAAVYYAAGYLSLKKWFTVGAAYGVLNLAIWFAALSWWTIIGITDAAEATA